MRVDFKLNLKDEENIEAGVFDVKTRKIKKKDASRILIQILS